jgi:PAS domain S-box-containing protein
VPFSLPPLSPPPQRLGLWTIAGSSVAMLCLAASLYAGGRLQHGAKVASVAADQVHTTELAAETLLVTLTDAETAQRGYLLTGDVTYLRPYEAAIQRLAQDFAAIAQAPLRDSARDEEVAQLRRLAATRLGLIGTTIDLRRAGRADEALAIVRGGQGEQVMDAIRQHVRLLQSHARLEMTQHRRAAGSRAGWAIVAALAAAGCLLLGGVIVLQNRFNSVVTVAFNRLAEYTRAYAETDADRRRTDAMLLTIVETAPGLIYAKDRQGRMLLANQATLKLIGKSWADVEGRTDEQFLDDPTQGAEIMRNDQRVMDTGSPVSLEEAAGSSGRLDRFWLSTKTPLLGPAGEIDGLVGVSVEITDRKLVEERLRHMVNELNHRVKNTLATVQSIAVQTLRGRDEEVRRALETRLLALASAHDILTREGWEGADLTAIVASALAPHGGVQAGRFVVQGAPLRLAPRAALALSMGLHELVTNALKYGALSAACGQISIAWSISGGQSPTFSFTWAEHGGPPVVPPAHRGFGTRMIERSLARDIDGEVVLQFLPPGVVCRIVAPRESVMAPADIVPFPQIGEMKWH